MSPQPFGGGPAYCKEQRAGQTFRQSRPRQHSKRERGQCGKERKQRAQPSDCRYGKQTKAIRIHKKAFSDPKDPTGEISQTKGPTRDRSAKWAKPSQNKKEATVGCRSNYQK